MPTDNTLLRRSLDQWFARIDVHPNAVAEFEDSALLKMFGEHGSGIFPAPSIVEKDICQHYDVRVVGRTDEVRERFYAITIERRMKHPAAVAISDYARTKLFG